MNTTSNLQSIAPSGNQKTIEIRVLSAKINNDTGCIIDGISQSRDDIATLIPLRVCCLGSFEVGLGWNKVQSWRTLKAKSLLKYLIAQQGRSIPKDTLIETLWPECDPQAANNNLKTTVYLLRQTITPNMKEPPYILFMNGSYMINPDVKVEVDTDEFERQWATGRRLEQEGRRDEAAKAFKLAEQLYHGDYLEEDLYEEWTLVRREALKNTYLSILSKLSEYSFENDAYEDCINYCHKTLAKDPCHENAYRFLMRCHSRLGQRNCAINWYRLCAKAIKSELDTTPDSQTTSLYQRLLKNEYT